jgi:DNA polymerase (family 10)
MLDATQIAQLLRELAQRMALQGGNAFRARAYRRAAENLLLTPTPIGELIAEGRLQQIPGVGESIGAVITELHQTGRHARLEALREELPSGVLEMLRIPGLRPERVRKLHEQLGISSLAELEQAARSGRLASIKGYGPAFQAQVLRGIDIALAPSGRHIHHATQAVQYTRRELLRSHPEWTQLTVAGQLRRGCELVGALALVALDPGHRGASRTAILADGMTLNVTGPDRYGSALLLATGSERHLLALQALAMGKGWILDAAGLRTADRLIASDTEQAIYSALGLPFIAPELRETGDEVQRALEGRLPALLLQEDIRGVLHAHTDQSDGADTLADMAEATRQGGYEYLGLTDHSQTAHYAGGLKTQQVRAQQRAIDELNGRYGAEFHVFKGIESDILQDGSLDYAEDLLAGFELIIASVHSRFRMNRQQQTERILTAIGNPHTTILGHLTGRLLLRRPGYELDMERVLAACAEHGVAVEINGNPWRLDLDWRWCQCALDLGCLLSIDPDAHATTEIDNMHWGVLMARKGGVPKDRVLNALDRTQFQAHLSERKRRAAVEGKRRRG